ncbi:MAG: membrane protein insertase YidC [Endomicrobiales bacterium]|nr:membrane protein insertase YidC [Endomicrobiales bacterium]
MEKNTFWAVLLSTLFLIAWWTFFQPKPVPRQEPAETAKTDEKASRPLSKAAAVESGEPDVAVRQPEDKEIVVETANYRAVFTTRGAAIKKWLYKENSGQYTDLIYSENSRAFVTFPGSVFKLSRPEPLKLVFTHRSPLGFRIIKTYDLSEDFLHSLNIEVSRIKPSAKLPPLQIDWGPGLGTSDREKKENDNLIRAVALTSTKPKKLTKFKPGEYPAAGYKWFAVDNRYFLSAVIPDESAGFTIFSVYKPHKKVPPGILLSKDPLKGETSYSCAMNFYLGPKGQANLKSYGFDLEESIDFGFFGSLGKLALAVLFYFKNLTGNYGWAIILLTIILQIIVLPLTVKSFKATAAMKQLQPHIKTLQDKYKTDPKRLNVEMLNLYKTHKVNPLGGCLPMLLQLPIFWALFTTLRNSFELRGAHWILWVKDLSAPDTLIRIAGIPLNVLPLVMGIGMFVQQKMMSATTDPAQAKMMYLMPVLFTFMFWNFPSGLVMYWLTNSLLTMIEQYVILKRQETGVPAVKA